MNNFRTYTLVVRPSAPEPLREGVTRCIAGSKSYDLMFMPPAIPQHEEAMRNMMLGTQEALGNYWPANVSLDIAVHLSVE